MSWSVERRKEYPGVFVFSSFLIRSRKRNDLFDAPPPPLTKRSAVSFFSLLSPATHAKFLSASCTSRQQFLAVQCSLILYTHFFYAWRSTPSLGEQHDEGENFFTSMASELPLSSFPLPGRVHVYRKMLFSASFVLYCFPIMRFIQVGEHTVSSNSCLQGNLTYPTTVCNLNFRPFLPCTLC